MSQQLQGKNLPNFIQAFDYLETVLAIDYDGHTQLYEFFTDLEVQKAIFKIIEQYKS